MIFALPENLLAPYNYLSRASLTRPELCPFVTAWLSAYLHDDTLAIRNALLLGGTAYIAAAHSGVALSQDERDLTNAMTFLNNKLAQKIEAAEAAQAQPNVAPVTPIAIPEAEVLNVAAVSEALKSEEVRTNA